MIRRMLGVIALAVTIAFTTVTVGCGYILHPERRGTRSGQIDGMTLLFDCLWLLVGIIPGVVFLIVDFTSGAIYRGGGRAYRVKGDGKVSVRLPAKVKKQTKLELRLTTADGRLLDSSAITLGPDVFHPGSLSVDLGRATREAKQLGDDAKNLKLVLVNEQGRTANMSLQVE